MAISHPAASPAPPCPPSPGVGGVPLSSAIGDLLRFVLSSHAAGTGNPDHDPAAFPLSPSYCARLLDDDGDLCGKLAAGIEKCLDEGRLPGPPAVAGIPVGEEGPEETEWEAVLLEKGAELKLAKLLRSFSFRCFSSSCFLWHESWIFLKKIWKGDYLTLFGRIWYASC